MQHERWKLLRASTSCGTRQQLWREHKEQQHCTAAAVTTPAAAPAGQHMSCGGIHQQQPEQPSIVPDSSSNSRATSNWGQSPDIDTSQRAKGP